jgi:hypothetical protein
MILCRECYYDEIRYRISRNRELGSRVFDLPSWFSLKVYDAS